MNIICNKISDQTTIICKIQGVPKSLFDHFDLCEQIGQRLWVIQYLNTPVSDLLSVSPGLGRHLAGHGGEGERLAAAQVIQRLKETYYLMVRSNLYLQLRVYNSVVCCKWLTERLSFLREHF